MVDSSSELLCVTELSAQVVDAAENLVAKHVVDAVAQGVAELADAITADD